MTANVQSISETMDIVHKFAVAVADAYINNYVDPDGRKVMNNPVVYYNRETGAFDWCSSLTPLSENEILIETIEDGIYGDIEPDSTLEDVRGWLIEFVVAEIDYNEFFSKIDPVTDEEI